MHKSLDFFQNCEFCRKVLYTETVEAGEGAKRRWFP